ncbi:DUF3265 domain-containing protein [Vibrio parahaemolyticus]|nr:DUF3265 domain-containing protein [Vibrio alginolyticus]MDF4459156.1 DUF3265 domain-containing protein [Vibrio parahaemolyticus]MDF4462632.1 DUF3265 domain-containing protein [Vibrio parahaemolyticus]MDF4467335.1 DUF3265 domain-containing protein [Vibrio parahaemolyticus]MDF4491481.1 DUF3265 domain-containing protein [Vibrio parahaemolyticus]MDG2566185.1 DUF3265 domain-containing protein [Vibrio parahaemolyticus]
MSTNKLLKKIPNACHFFNALVNVFKVVCG